MKTTDKFKEVIKAHLEEYAKKDSLFELNYNNPQKNLDDCIKFILTQVQKSGINGFEDEEIFNMAIHYYDEKELKIEDIKNCQVIVNHKIELTPEEIEKEKEKARQTIFNTERDRLTKKLIKKNNRSTITTSTETDKKEETKIVQGSLF